MRNPAHGMRDATSAKNAPRNRYSNVMPFDHNRVELSHPQDYINASHITVSSGAVQWAYIATQGPLERTCGDFW